MKVAIVCDWLLGTGGAERVVLELHKMFPEAPIYTSQYNPNPKIWFGDKWFEEADIRTGWLQKIPQSLKKFLPLLRAFYFSRLDLSDYDLVISSSGAEAKFVRTKQAGALHVSYCHAPTHYYWSRYEDYLKDPGFGRLDFLARIGLKIFARPMRRWDYKAAQRPDYFITNSNYTKDQIKRYYGRDSVVIHPPVDIERFKMPDPLTSLKKGKPKILRKGFLTAGRQVPYKKIDLAVKAASKIDAHLIVIGRGPQHKKLKRIAGRTVTFLTKVSDADMPEKLAGAEAFIFPGVDDFGIVAVEAMAAGTPIIAYKDGGALDYVDAASGLFFNEQTVESLAEAMEQFSKVSFNHSQIAQRAEKFSADNFHTNFRQFLQQLHN